MIVTITKYDFADIFIAFSFSHFNDEKKNFPVIFVRISGFLRLN